jgi:chromosomal replication initiator protein
MNQWDGADDNNLTISDLSLESPTSQLPTVVPTSALRSLSSSGLNPALTFDRFVVGESNRETYEAAIKVSHQTEHQTERSTPLIIYGGIGLGKTHLLHAIGNRFSQQHLDQTVYCISAEKYLNDCLQLIANPTKYHEFQRRYHNIDLLLIDDIHLLMREPKIQEEFVDLLNQLSRTNRRIVCTCDRPPEFLEEYLSASDFLPSDLIVKISAPEFELRVSILKQKLQERNWGPVSRKVLHYLAKHLTKHIRQLEGTLNRLMAEARLGSQLNMQIARRVIEGSESTVDATNEIGIETIQESVARYFHITLSDLCSRRRAKRFALPRQVGMYLVRQLTALSLKQISNGFGQSHHSIVVHSCQRIETLLKEDLVLNQSIEALKAELTRNAPPPR